MEYIKTTLCVLLLLLHPQKSSTVCDLDKACFPPDFNLLDSLDTLSQRTLSVTSTCGETTETTYKSFNYSDSTSYTCTAESNKQKMYDGTDITTLTITRKVFDLTTYWQSALTVETTGENATSTPQEIIVNATDVFLISEIRVYFIAPNTDSTQNTDGRPQAMSIERMVDGRWEAWRYFAEHCKHFPGIQIYDSSLSDDPTSVYCTTFTRYQPSPLTEEKNVHFLELHPSLETGFEEDRTLMDYFSTSAIRIRLTRPAQMDILKSYYAVADLKVGAKCLCYGHADKCTGENQNTCECGHNTEGDNCERCKPLFNNKPWRIATIGSPNPCEACVCNKHATSCTYDEVKGHGVCGNCTQNTAGDYCTDCIQGYFVNPSQVENATVTPSPLGTRCRGIPGYNGIEDIEYDCNDYCIPCDCSGQGTVESSSYLCNTTTGQCVCKQYVTGRKCDQCLDEYHSLSSSNVNGCTVCSCDPRGTYSSTNFCNKETGRCVCKTNTEGSSCDSCKSEFYGLSVDNVADGCTPCSCDVGGALNNVCNNISGQCSCRDSKLLGRDCTQVATGYFVPKLDYFTLEAEFGTINGGTIVEEPGHGQPTSNMTGLGYVELTPGGSVAMEIELPPGVAPHFEFLVRYKSTIPNLNVDVAISMKDSVQYTCDGTTNPTGHVWTQTLGLTGPTEKALAQMTPELCLKDGQTYEVVVQSATSNTGNVLIDSVMFLPVITKLSSFNSKSDLQTNMTSCRDVIKLLNPEQRDALNCSGFEFSLMAEVFSEPILCNCNSTGTVATELSTCDPYGGQCTCKDGVILRECAVCQVDSYIGSDASCLPCNCDSLGSVNAFCDDTGRCSCKTNVTGDKCDACLLDNFGLNTGNGCTLCQCNLDYSINNTCSDDGQCLCKPGVGGLNCDICLDGFYNLTTDGCVACGCDPDGGGPGICDKDTGICTCKLNVQGDKCTECKSGFYGLGPWAADGCLSCFCSGHSNNCTTAIGWYETITESHWPLNNSKKSSGPRWLGQDDLGNDVTVRDPVIFSPNFPQFVMRIMNSGENLQKTHMYFLAPEKFLGNKKTAYGLAMTIHLRTSSVDNMLPTLREGDVILKGKYADFSLTRNLAAPLDTQTTKYQFGMQEAGWFVNSTDGTPATYTQMVETLSSLEAFKIRGKFSNTTDAEVDLYQVIMEHATQDNTSGRPVNNIEQCVCPEIYGGDNCELCGYGYRRIQSFSGAIGDCVKCECNNHAGTCDVESGVCNCTDNTTGDRCDACLPGYYGDPLNGQPDDCKPCTCPGDVIAGDVNVFATECIVNPDSAGPRCTNCSTGHGGNRCEVCVIGFYGQPENTTNNNGACTPCFCNSRADNCDSVTGVCTDCRENTTGAECQQCAPYFFGNPDSGPCQDCSCQEALGATGECDHETGACTCKPNVVDIGCDTCAPNTFNITSGQGCSDCNCDIIGSISTTCDVITGNCDCRSNVIGRQCDTCADGFWAINTLTGCNPCDCNQEGTDVTSGGKCDQVSGQCTCQNEATIGRQCDRCSPVTFGNYRHIRLFDLGSFPNCGLCGECFDSWAQRLDVIGDQIDAQRQEIEAIWKNYNNWKPIDAENIFNRIRDNISLAEDSIYRAGNFTDQLSTLQVGLKQISDRATEISLTVDTLEGEYNTAVQSLQELKMFVGNVDIDIITTVNVASLNTSVLSLSTEIKQRYAQGNETWQKIRELSILVGSTGDESRKLQSDVDAAMREMAVAMETHKLLLKIYNDSFLNGYNNNEQALSSANETLTTAKNRLAEIEAILSSISSQFALARPIVDVLLATTGQQLEQMSLAREQSGLTKLLGEAVLAEAKDTITNVREYLTLATDSNGNITASFNDVIEGIQSLRELMTKLDQAKTDGQAVKDTTLRPLSEMQILTSQIANTVINTDNVALTNQKADAALATANIAMLNTQKAREDSQRAKEDVEGIQDALTQAQQLRTDALTIKAENDQNNQSIHSILTELQSNIDTVTSLASSTVGSISSVNSYIAAVTQCFTDRNSEAIAIRTTAQNVLLKVNETSKSLADIDPIKDAIAVRAGQIDATEGLASIEQTNNQLQTVLSSFSRVEGVTDVQALLQNYIAQNQDVENLKSVLEGLETELDSVLALLTGKDVASETRCTTN